MGCSQSERNLCRSLCEWNNLSVWKTNLCEHDTGWVCRASVPACGHMHKHEFHQENLIIFPINYRYHAFPTFSSPSWRFQPPGKLLARRLKRNSNYFSHLKEWKWHIKHNNQCTSSLVFAHFCFTHDHTVLCRHDGTSLFPRFNVLHKPASQIQHGLRWKPRYSPVIFFKKSFSSFNCL